MAGIPVENLRRQDSLRIQLMDAIRRDHFARIDVLIKSGAPLSAHYYHPAFCHFAANPTDKDASLVNPVDWATLDLKFQAALYILDVGAGMVDMAEARPRPAVLPEIDLARETRVAVNQATHYGHIRLVKMLVEMGASVGQCNNEGYSALAVAIQKNHREIMTYLLQHQAWDLEKRQQQVWELAEKRGLTIPLCEAGCKVTALPEFVDDDRLPKAKTEFISEECAPREQTPSTRPGTAMTYERCRSPDHPVHSRLDNRVLSSMECRLLGELRVAIRKADSAKIQGLMARGVPIEAEFDLGYGMKGTCIDWACVASRPEVALLILKLADGQGLGDKLATQATAAFFWSVSQGYLEVLEELLRRGTDVGKRAVSENPDDSDTALRVAVVGAQKAEITLLLRYGAWKTETENNRRNLLALASTRRKSMEGFKDAGFGDFDSLLEEPVWPFKDFGIDEQTISRPSPIHWETQFSGTQDGGM